MTDDNLEKPITSSARLLYTNMYVEIFCAFLLAIKYHPFSELKINERKQAEQNTLASHRPERFCF